MNGDGQITNYGYNWDDKVIFDQTDTPISKEKAEQLFHEKADLSLQYQIPYNGKGNVQPMIAYLMNGVALDAATGEIWNGALSANAGNKPLTDKPLGAKPPANLNITKEEAVKKITTLFNLSSDYKLQRASYNEYTSPETGETSSNWNMSWNVQATDASDDVKMLEGSNVWANINSKTGEIMNFNLNGALPIWADG